MKEFFDSNNEKVRVHPKNEQNRKMNYYEEIIASFPDDTCDLVKKEAEKKRIEQETRMKELQEKEVQRIRKEAEIRIQEEATMRARAEEEARIQEEKVQRTRAEAEIRIQKEIEARKQAEKEIEKWKELLEKAKNKQSVENKVEEIIDQNNELPEVNSKKEAPLTREQIENIIEREKKKYDRLKSIIKPSEAGEKKIKGAIGSYANDVLESDIIGICDFSILGSGKMVF